MDPIPHQRRKRVSDPLDPAGSAFPPDLLAECKRLGLEITGDLASRIGAFIEHYLRWNRAINFSSLKDAQTTYERHVLDSLHLYNLLLMTDRSKIVDIGSGAGFPGMILAMLFPQRPVLLVEPRKKPYAFLKLTVASLALPNVNILQRRSTEMGPSSLDGVLVSRAVLPPREWVEEALRVGTPSTYIIVMTGAKEDDLPQPDKLPGGMVLIAQREVTLPRAQGVHRNTLLRITHKPGLPSACCP